MPVDEIRGQVEGCPYTQWIFGVVGDWDVAWTQEEMDTVLAVVRPAMSELTPIMRKYPDNVWTFLKGVYSSDDLYSAKKDSWRSSHLASQTVEDLALSLRHYFGMEELV